MFTLHIQYAHKIYEKCIINVLELFTHNSAARSLFLGDNLIICDVTILGGRKRFLKKFEF